MPRFPSFRRPRPSRPRPAALASTLAISALVAAGCGSDDSPSTSSKSGSGSDADQALVTKAQQEIEAAKKPLEFTAPGPEIDAAKLAGKTVQVISVDQRVPTLAAAATAMQQAGKVAGLEVNLFDAKAEVTRMTQGVTQAIDQKAGAIVLLGIPTALVKDKLATAELPVVAVLNNDPKADAPGQGAGEGVYATSAPPYTQAGRLIANKAIVDTKGKADVILIGSKGLDPSVPTQAGIESVLTQCKGCKVTKADVPLADWSTKLAGLTQSELRRNPNAKYVLTLFDGMGIFAATGVRQAGAGSKVSVAAFNGVPAGLKLVQDGDVLTADPGQSNEWTGWHAIDQSMRGMLDQEPADPAVPLRFFDTESLKGVDVNSETALYGDAFKAGYRELWGVN